MLDNKTIEEILDYFLNFVGINFDIFPSEKPTIRYISNLRKFAQLGELSRSEEIFGVCIPDKNLIILNPSSHLSIEGQIQTILHELSHWVFYSFSEYGREVAQKLAQSLEERSQITSDYGIFGVHYFDDEGFAHWLSRLLLEHMFQNKDVFIGDEESYDIVKHFQEWQEKYGIYSLWYQMGFRINLTEREEFHEAIILPLLRSEGLLPKKGHLHYKRFEVNEEKTLVYVTIEIEQNYSRAQTLDLPWLKLEVLI